MKADVADRALDSLASVTPSAPAMSSMLEAELRSLAPVTPRRPLRQLAILVGVSLVYGAGWLAALTLRVDMSELPRGWLLLAGLAWLLGFLLPCYLALVPRAGSVMPRYRWAAFSAILTSVFFVMLGLLVHPHGPSSLYYGWEKFAHGHACLEIGLATALVPTIIGAVFLRGALPVRSRWVAAALGAGGGGLGGLVLHLYCRIADGLHVGLIHGGVVGVAALLAALFVPRVTDRPLA